jgi:enamine deaminase RidA (YjgF/YER057c/UK114 family)
MKSEPVERGEARAMFEVMRAVLERGESDFEHVLRLDQYYRTPRAVDAYHQARHGSFGRYIPASTSMLMRDLLLPCANMDVQMVASRKGSPNAPRAMHHEDLWAPATSGFSPVIVAGDLVLLAGFIANTASNKPNRRGLAPEACVPEGTLWRGTQIGLETRYVIESQILPALALAGSSAQDMVKAQVYLTHHDDLGGFLQVWSEYFGSSRAALTVVPSPNPSIGVADARVEINVVAVRSSARASREVIETSVPSAYDCSASAVRVGDLLFLSGLMVTDEAAQPLKASDADYAAFEDLVELQTRSLIAHAEVICAAAGASLRNVVRIQQFHCDVREFYSAARTLASALPGRSLPFSAVGIAPPLPVVGSRVMLDLWVYAPTRNARKES